MSNPIKINTVGLYNNATNQCMVTHNEIYRVLGEIAGMVQVEGSINLFRKKDPNPDHNLPWQPLFKLTSRGFVELPAGEGDIGRFYPVPDTIFNLLINALRNPETEIFCHEQDLVISIFIDGAMYRINTGSGHVSLQYHPNSGREVDLSSAQAEDIRILAAARYNQLYG